MIPKFAQGVLQNEANFGIGTLAHGPTTWKRFVDKLIRQLEKLELDRPPEAVTAFADRAPSRRGVGKDHG